MKSKSANQAAVAEAAGVSKTTVSMALRGHLGISSETRARVRAVADALGYRPNPMISALMRQVHGRRPSRFPVSLAYVTSGPERDGWRRNGILRRFHAGACARAGDFGYTVEEYWLGEPGMTGMRLSHILWTRSIVGVILAPLPRGRGHVRMEWERFAVAAINHSLWRPVTHRAAQHQGASLSQAVRNIRRLGYRRIALAIPEYADADSDHNWSASFLMNRNRHNGDGTWHMLVTRDWKEEVFARWFRDSRPEIGMSTEGRVVDWMCRLGVRVPRDAGFVNLECGEQQPGCAGIMPNADLVGATAADLVIGQLERNERGLPSHPKVVLVDGEWVDGETIAGNRAFLSAAA